MDRKSFVIISICLIGIFASLFVGFNLKTTSKPAKIHHLTLSQRLNLTPAQIKAEKAIREEAKSDIKPILYQLTREHEELEDSIKQHASKKRILLQKQIIDQLNVKYQQVHKEHLIKFEKILTDKQKDTFKNIRNELFLSD